MNERDQVLRKARKTRSEKDWSRYKTLRNQCKNLLKKSGSQYNKNVIEEDAFQLFTLQKKKAFLFKDCVWQPPKEHFRKATDTFKFQCVFVLFIKKHLKSLKRNKAGGLDDLPTGMIKDCCDYIAKPLCHIISLSLVTMTVPSE